MPQAGNLAGGAGMPAASGVNPGSLTPHAASGAVLLSAAIENNKMPAEKPEIKSPGAPQLPGSKPPLAMQKPQGPQKPQLPAQQAGSPPAQKPELSPAQQAEVAKMHQPYIDLGKAIASGKNTWA
jgi:hypothetical protein